MKKLMVLAAVLVFISFTDIAISSEINDDDIRMYTRYCDLIIIGNVLSMEVIRVNPVEYSNAGIITEMTIQIEEVVSGKLDDTQLTITIIGGEIEDDKVVIVGSTLRPVEIDDKVLIGLSQRSYGQTDYMLYFRNCFFKYSNGYYESCIEESDLKATDIVELIKEEVKKQDIEQLTKSAEVVCIGDIVEVYREHPIVNTKIKIQVAEVIKGNIGSEYIIIKGDPIDPNYVLRRDNERVLLFLKRASNSEYIVQNGTIGMIRVLGNELESPYGKKLNIPYEVARKNIVQFRKE